MDNTKGAKNGKNRKKGKEDKTSMENSESKITETKSSSKPKSGKKSSVKVPNKVAPKELKLTTQSKLNAGNRSIATLYSDAKDKKERIKNLKTKFESEGFHPVPPSSSEASNQFMLHKFIAQYNEALHQVLPNIASVENLAKGTKNGNVTAEKMNLYQLNQFFEALKLISPPEVPSTVVNTQGNKRSSPDRGFSPNLTEGSLRQQEKKLVTQVWEHFKDDEGNIKTKNLFLFLIAVLNLYDTYMVNEYKKHNKEILKTEGSVSPKKHVEIVLTEEGQTTNNAKGSQSAKKSAFKNKNTTKDENKSKELKESVVSTQKETKEQILAKVQSELNSKIKLSKKYCSYDNDNVFVLSFNNAKAIMKDFKIFYVNWSNYEYNNARSLRTEENQHKLVDMPFKPEIDHKSAKIFNEYRKKIQHNCK